MVSLFYGCVSAAAAAGLMLREKVSSRESTEAKVEGEKAVALPLCVSVCRQLALTDRQQLFCQYSEPDEKAHTDRRRTAGSEFLSIVPCSVCFVFKSDIYTGLITDKTDTAAEMSCVVMVMK